MSGGQRRRTAHLALLGALALLSACFAPDIPEGLTCADNGKCPSGQVCGSTGLCVAIDEADLQDTDAPDASTVDAAPKPDAAPLPDANPVLQTLTFEYTGVITSFVVPEGVTELSIEAYGAAGGDDHDVHVGGRGARMKGDFTVEPGEVLKILVGERGQDAVTTYGVYEQGGGSGGGGSFVVTSANVPLLIAGGGGGACYRPTDGSDHGGDGQITEEGQAGGGTLGGAGGQPGQGGATSTNENAYHVGAGGGGFATAGVGLSDGNPNYGTPNAPGSSFLEGGAGGVGGSRGRDGGFGGGGSAGYLGGGGGGYSGGGSAHTTATTHGGGGGGSYNAGANPDNSPGVREGNGVVIISWQE